MAGKSGNRKGSGGSSEAAKPPASAGVASFRDFGDHSRLDRWEWFAVAGMMIVGALLRLYRLGHADFMGDEIGSLESAMRSLSEIMRHSTDFPPLHMVLVHWSIRLFGVGEFGARLPSAVLSTAWIPVQYLMGRHLFGRRIGLFSTAFITLSMYHMFFGREGHSYGPYGFFGGLSFYYFCRITVNRVARARMWAGYVLATLGMLWSHYVGAAACVLQAAIVLVLLATALYRREVRWARTLFAGFAVSGVLVILGMLPYLSQMMSSAKGETVVSSTASSLMRITPTLIGFVFMKMGFGNGIGLFLFVGLLGAGIVLAFRRSWRTAALLVFWIVFPYVLFSTIEFGHAVSVRYFFFSFPAVALLVAFGMDFLAAVIPSLAHGRKWAYVPAVAVVALWGWKMMPAYRHFYSMTSYDQPKKLFARWMSESLPDGTIVLYSNYYLFRWVGPGYYKATNKTFAYAGIWNYFEDFAAQGMRERYKAFLEKYPEAAFAYAQEFSDKLGWWELPRRHFAQYELFANWGAIKLAREGLYCLYCEYWDEKIDDNDESVWKYRTVVLDIFYNTEADLVKRAHEKGALVLRRLLDGFGFTLTQDGRDWLVLSDTARVAVHQFGSEPADVVMKVNAVALGGVEKLEVGGEAGTIGVLQLANGRLGDYSLVLPRMPSGRHVVSLRVVRGRNTTQAPSALLIGNITFE